MLPIELTRMIYDFARVKPFYLAEMKRECKRFRLKGAQNFSFWFFFDEEIDPGLRWNRHGFYISNTLLYISYLASMW